MSDDHDEVPARSWTVLSCKLTQVLMRCERSLTDQPHNLTSFALTCVIIVGLTISYIPQVSQSSGQQAGSVLK